MAVLEIIRNEVSIKYNYPKGWDELTKAQYLHICEILATYDTAEAQIRVIQYLFKFKRNFWKPDVKVAHLLTLQPAYLHTIVSDENILGWIFTAHGPTKILIPKVRVNFTTYYAPYKSLANLACVELIAAWYSYSQFSKTQDINFLNKLVALLYRPKEKFRLLKPFAKRYNNDVREPLNQARWDSRISTIDKLPMGVKVAILKQFSAHWQVFEKKYPTIFTKSVKASSNDSSLMAMLYDVSGKIFGDMEKTEMTAADKVFFYVSKQIKEAKEAKEANEKLRMKS